jgi:prevent-host-death family protein
LRRVFPVLRRHPEILIVVKLHRLTIVIDHGIDEKGRKVKEIAISEFKAKCLGILEQVRKTRKPIRVTRFGQPVAEVVPPSPGEPKGRRLGSMAGTAEIVGDIVGPTGSLDDWEAAK